MSITNLPPEILSHICEYLEPQEWGALRITCHQIHGSTLEAYATRYFNCIPW
ncbi:F-box domain, cyclin-like [Penicillium roqueforti FM164]|uniref:F-box domain, cyclin-like n=1 Tax=Penicillium roqueforti (strain FM164) TaxID=1365484 RepID=W6QNI3_PENRF|nr:F-box domain, cyclin-like [Penicillium roqueforti FM164]